MQVFFGVWGSASAFLSSTMQPRRGRPGVASELLRQHVVIDLRLLTGRTDSNRRSQTRIPRGSSPVAAGAITSQRTGSDAPTPSPITRRRAATPRIAPGVCELFFWGYGGALLPCPQSPGRSARAKGPPQIVRRPASRAYPRAFPRVVAVARALSSEISRQLVATRHE
jgi:hypothetical protein